MKSIYDMIDYLTPSASSALSSIQGSVCPCCRRRIGAMNAFEFDLGFVDATTVADVCDVCDNRKWNWRCGEPPFCCGCASRKGLGSLSHFGCEKCKMRRSKLYKRTSWFNHACKHCHLPRSRHVNSHTNIYPACAITFSSELVLHDASSQRDTIGDVHDKDQKGRGVRCSRWTEKPPPGDHDCQISTLKSCIVHSSSSQVDDGLELKEKKTNMDGRLLSRPSQQRINSALAGAPSDSSEQETTLEEFRITSHHVR